MTGPGGRRRTRASARPSHVSEAEYCAVVRRLGPGASAADIGSELGVTARQVRRYRALWPAVDVSASTSGPVSASDAPPVSVPTCPPGHVVLGLADGGHPVTCPPCSVTVYGRSGSGKTTAAAALALAFEQLGAELLVGDPHAGAGPDCLSGKLGLDPDDVPDEAESIARLVAAAHDELAQRKGAGLTVAAGARLLILVLDEFLEAAFGQVAMQRQLGRILTGGRKYGVHVILCSQLVTSRDLPTWLRHPAGAVVMHAVHGGNSWHALGVHKRDLEVEPAMLEPGQACVRAPGVAGVPLVRVRDPGVQPARQASPRQLEALMPEFAAERAWWVEELQERARELLAAGLGADVQAELQRLAAGVVAARSYRELEALGDPMPPLDAAAELLDAQAQDPAPPAAARDPEPAGGGVPELRVVQGTNEEAELGTTRDAQGRIVRHVMRNPAGRVLEWTPGSGWHSPATGA